MRLVGYGEQSRRFGMMMSGCQCDYIQRELCEYQVYSTRTEMALKHRTRILNFTSDSLTCRALTLQEHMIVPRGILWCADFFLHWSDFSFTAFSVTTKFSIPRDENHTTSHQQACHSNKLVACTRRLQQGELS